MEETESLFGYLAYSFAKKPENLATEALAYILHKSPVASQAFLSVIREGLKIRVPENLRFSTQVHGQDQSIPDLVGVDKDNEQVVIVEAKFWAGLTSNQPVTYLERLPKTSQAVLLFLTPGLRKDYLWPELIRRCKEKPFELSEDQDSGMFKMRKVGDLHTLAICSWKDLLGQLVKKVSLYNDEMTTVHDMEQLLGLCYQMDSKAFLPLRSEELTSTIGSRLLQFYNLVDAVADKLLGDDGPVTYLNSRTSSGRGTYYRPIGIHGYWCYLMVSPPHWSKLRPTPIWLSIRDNKNQHTQKVRDALSSLESQDPALALFFEVQMVVPLELPFDKEEEEVKKELVEQICHVAEVLKNYSLATTETSDEQSSGLEPEKNSESSSMEEPKYENTEPVA